MLFENDVSNTFWREAINTTVYTMNKVQIIKGMDKTPYELWFGHSPSVKYFRIFGINFILREMMTLVSLIQEVMKVCFLDIH